MLVRLEKGISTGPVHGEDSCCVLAGPLLQITPCRAKLQGEVFADGSMDIWGLIGCWPLERIEVGQLC